MSCSTRTLMPVFRLILAALSAGLVVILVTGRAEAQRPTFSLAKPHPFGRQSDAGSRFIQVAALSDSGRPDGAAVNGAETKIRHEATVVPPADGNASYSFSVGAYTTTGYWLQMGYLVLGSDGANRPRWFVQVLDCRTGTSTCTTAEWKMSRAGEAYVPPACSACSGDAGAGGYPFAFTSDAGGTWTFWFDGIKKHIVRLGAPHAAIDTARVYFLGEVTHPSNPGAYSMGPRSTVRTLRLWSNQAGSWAEPAVVSVAAATQNGPASACPAGYGIAYLRAEWDSFAGASFHQVKAGSGVVCPVSGTLWTVPASES